MNFRNISKYYQIAIVFLFIYCSVIPLNAADDITILHQRLFSDYMTTHSSSNASEYLGSQLPDGSWPDINYDDRSITNWDPVKHLERIKIMSHAYNNSANTFLYQNSDLLDAIQDGLIFWANQGCYSNNWWFNDIGQQRQLGVIVVLMKGYLNESSMNSACKYLVMPPATHAGTNLVWLSTSLIQHGIAKDSLELIREAVDNIRSTIYITLGEGVQRDYSYLFHGMQVYNGGYGSWLIGDVTLWMYNLRGLEPGFSKDDIEMMSRFLLEGDQWMMRNNQYDFGSAGRNISRKSGISSSHLKTYLERMKTLNPSRTNEFQAFIDHINKTSNTSLTGNKMFWRADFMVNRTPSSYVGVKMCSNRTNGTEFMNNENKLGFWLPFGATCIMKNASEYYNIYPLWDWTKIPGITCPEVTPAFGAVQTQSKSFVGGVTNGKFGLACMDFEKELTRGKKSWFFYEDVFIALGAGIISTHSNKVNTTLNQCFKVGSILVDGTPVASASNQKFENASWLHHGNIAYIFPEPSTVYVSNSSVSGNWNTINATESSSTITGDVVKLWISHGIKPSNESYAYLVNTSILPHQMEDYVQNLPFRILSNTETLQAVYHPSSQITAIVFYTPGIFRVDEGLEITVNESCALLIDQSTNPLTVTAADPNQKLSSLEIGLNFGGGNYEILPLDLPNNDNQGRSVTRQAKTVRKSQVDGIKILNEPVLPLDRNKIFQLETMINISENENGLVDWKSDNEDIAVVNSNGEIFTRNYGKANITASIANGAYQDEIQVDIKKKIIDDSFESCDSLIIYPGGAWDCSGGILKLTSAFGSTVPSPENNMVLYNKNVAGDFVIHARMKTEASISPFNDFCLIWDHENAEENYNYIHLSERNDFYGSGIFRMDGVVKSVEQEDIPFPIEAGKWNDIILKRQENEILLLVNGEKFLQTGLSLAGEGLVGFGSYNDPCEFDDLKVWVESEPLIIESTQSSLTGAALIRLFPNPSRGIINICLPPEMAGASLNVFDPLGRAVFNRTNCKQNMIVDMSDNTAGLYIFRLTKNQTCLTGKIMITN